MRALLLLILVALAACRSPQPVREQAYLYDSDGNQRRIENTEFHRVPVKNLPIFYLSQNYRGVDSTTDVPFTDRTGFGATWLRNMELPPVWTGHKFLYYAMDFELAPERAGGVYPYDKNWNFHTGLGLFVRSYLPWFFKIHYGVGARYRFGETPFGRYAGYAQVGLEYRGITSDVLFLTEPGQGSWTNEYRIGYMYAPIN